ncbi:MAG: TetR/AcrR family transcriptional regulator [Ilumatobacteraceae bacterium]|nr:TetR/AcrR family transcriptional regulator [Ilumatobacteraceae bacterium]
MRLNRAIVVDMAAQIADAEGIDAVTLTRIATDAGVKQPALYRHVTGIEELWTLLSLRAREQLVIALEDAIAGTTRELSIIAAAHAWRLFVQQHPGLYSATDRVPSVGDCDIEQSLARVVSALSESLSGYRLTPTQRGHCARSLRSALHGFCVLEKDNGHPEPYAIEKSLKQLLELFCRGIEVLEKK